MTRRPPICRSFTLLAFLLASPFVFAHGDPEVPLYVAEEGLDSGRCENELTPCASIGYALTQAGKGTEIRVAEGTYEVANTEDLFHLLSDVVTVVGGYREAGSPFRAEPTVSTLTGVPIEYRPLLQERGFHVIADRKGMEPARAAEAAQMLQLHASLKSSLPLTPCTNGDAAGLPCDNVDLVAHVPFQDISGSVGSSNDVWGFLDLNTHREYVIVGFNRGTGVFDVTDPENPQEIGFIAGQNTVWRDIKVYQFFDAAAGRWKAYAYVTTDGANDGMIIIDLTGLPHFIVKRTYFSDNDFTQAHNVYISNTDFSTGVSLTGDVPTLVVAGANNDGGRYRAYSLANPLVPAALANAPTNDYMHDAASIIITDSRKDTQCGNGGAYCDVLLDFNETRIEIWDITNASNPSQLSSTPYAGARYVHSGWWSEDKQFMFVHDELDEQGSGINTTLRIFSLTDLTSPQQVGTWTGPTNAIDHNGFVRGNRYYMSNYARGLTVLDITNPAIPVAVGRLDTYPFADGSSFVGAWGAYPYLPSGTIAISDIDSGLYLARDMSRDVPQGQLAFAAAAFAATEGQQTQIVVQRSGGSAGSVSVGYEVLYATADGADVLSMSGTLGWGNGDIADKNILLTADDDGTAEGLEAILVRLVHPTGGATLGNGNMASVYVSDVGTASSVGFATATVDIAENDGVPAVITLQRTGSAAGAASVDYSMSAGDAQAGINYQGSTSGTIAWPDGDAGPRTLVFQIIDDATNNPSSFIELSLSNANGAAIDPAATTIQLVIEDGAGSDQVPNSIAGAAQTLDERSAVTLDGGQSNDPDGDPLEYEWVQTSGPVVSLSDSTSTITNFTAPSVSSDSMLSFQLTVFDTRGSSDASIVIVTVNNIDGGGGGGGRKKSGGALGWPLLLGLGLLALRRRVAARQHP